MISKNSLINFTCIAILSELVYHVYKRIRRKSSTAKSLTASLIKFYDCTDQNEQFNKVIFFPDVGLSCRRTLSGRICRDKNCVAVHEATSLNVLLNIIKLTSKKLDVCVYMITCGILGDALVQCFERGVFVRIITDERNSGEEGETTGAQIGKLRAAGINVCCHSTSFWMHHKFLIADDEILVNGSFNWTNQAVMGNFENLIITSEKNLVEPFKHEFQKLWDKFRFTDIEEV